MQFLILGIAAFVTSGLVYAHPGHDIKQELAARAKLQEGSRRDISHCSAKLKAQGIERRTIERRTEILRVEREKRGLPTGTLPLLNTYR